MAYWDLSTSATLAAALEANVISNYFAPETINVWSPTDPLFSQPNTVSGSLVPNVDTCGTDGQRLEPVAGGVALAGYTAVATANEAVIISGNGGNTILFGFVPGLYPSDGGVVELYENAISQFVGSGLPETVPVPTPTLSATGLILLMLPVLVLGGLSVRRYL